MSDKGSAGPLERIVSFRHQSVDPTEDGTYLLLNQCDGYHIAECLILDGEFVGFHWFGGEYIAEDFYVAWAKLPDSLSLHPFFADDSTEAESSHEVALDRVAAQRAVKANANSAAQLKRNEVTK